MAEVGEAEGEEDEEHEGEDEVAAPADSAEDEGGG